MLQSGHELLTCRCISSSGTRNKATNVLHMAITKHRDNGFTFRSSLANLNR